MGPIATGALKQLHLDVLFLGVHGMDADAGFTTPNLLEAETDRAFVAAARKTVVLADHTKWGMLGISTIASLDEADEVISDAGLGPEAQRSSRERVGRLRLASSSSGAAAGLPDLQLGRKDAVLRFVAAMGAYQGADSGLRHCLYRLFHGGQGRPAVLRFS